MSLTYKLNLDVMRERGIYKDNIPGEYWKYRYNCPKCGQSKFSATEAQIIKYMKRRCSRCGFRIQTIKEYINVTYDKCPPKTCGQITDEFDFFIVDKYKPCVKLLLDQGIIDKWEYLNILGNILRYGSDFIDTLNKNDIEMPAVARQAILSHARDQNNI